MDSVFTSKLADVKTPSVPVNVGPNVKQPLDDRGVVGNAAHVQDILAIVSVSN